ncbi:MAG: hypothetical protein IJW26_05390, partial [Clostridia bacterium]|nr:hypothetical protein [Clostridia bacterium]
MKKGIKFLIFLLIATLFVGLSACGGKSSESESSSESQSTGGQQQEIEIAIIGGASVEEFETLTLTATVTGSEEDVVWSSSNPQVATVEGGVVSALSVGETVISASIGETTATHTVTVVASSYAHVMEFSVTSLALFEEESSSVNVYVSHKGERLDNATCGLEYVWTVVNGDENAVTLETSENGAVASFTGLSAGVVTYEVTTVARGYEVYAQFSVEVYETTLGLSFENTAIKPLEGGHGVELTLGSETTDRLTIGKILLVENGTPSDEEVSVQWTSADENVVTVESGVITAKKAGSATLTGIAVYDGEEITVTVSVSVLKLNVTIDDVITIETAVDSTITLPNTITESEIVKVTINSSNVVYDSLNEIGSLDGKVITVGENTMPSKMQDLGEGKTITVETDVKIYTINADVYTLIINDKQELDTWQEKAAENAIRAGICIEQQKGFAYSGYFVLGNNIDYNGQWKPYKDYNALWALSKDNTNNTELKDGDEYIDGVIEESWTAANYGGFQGTFDGKGYNIDGLEVLDRYSGFIVVMGTNGVVQNLSFTDAVIGSEAGLVVERGQGTVKDVYMEIDSFAEGAVTFYKKGSAPVRTVERVIIDVTDCKLTNLNSGFLGSECNGNAYIGVYVIGVGEDLANRLFDDVNEKSSIGYFADLTALVTDGNHGPNVSSWGDFWTVTENLVLPSSIINSYGGQISFVNSETVIAFGESITLATDKDAKYIRYSLKDEVENVSLSGNVLSADQNAVVGTPVTVVATSLIDGLTAEITLTVSNPLAYKTVETELYAETSSNSAILYYDGFVAGATYSVTVNGAISNATVEVDGQLTVTVSGLTVSTADSLSVYTIVCKNDVEQIEFTNVIAVTKILKTAEDINVLNGAKAGAGNYISGYYLLGNDIDCQDALYEAGSYSTGFFRAVFDGNGYTISNIKVGSCGIFGALYGATIKDVNFENVSIVSTANNFNALLAGSVTNNTT